MAPRREPNVGDVGDVGGGAAFAGESRRHGPRIAAARAVGLDMGTRFDYEVPASGNSAWTSWVRRQRAVNPARPGREQR
ncbi:hypothetical protein predicted by Glimmer/Critica [Sorangium cellulosum So ce56]|uniref:Uncharacterized protein n=1 Tax=Sorangium cellulosum (strain So ce56) TaxID=448385 RepID=A9G9J1_SORC5|nr:hypothetical protein predicted by Glimmer/Critica [Sorangium cellulosum So ce56]